MTLKSFWANMLIWRLRIANCQPARIDLRTWLLLSVCTCFAPAIIGETPRGVADQILCARCAALVRVPAPLKYPARIRLFASGITLTSIEGAGEAPVAIIQVASAGLKTSESPNAVLITITIVGARVRACSRPDIQDASTNTSLSNRDVQIRAQGPRAALEHWIPCVISALGALITTEELEKAVNEAKQSAVIDSKDLDKRALNLSLALPQSRALLDFVNMTPEYPGLEALQQWMAEHYQTSRISIFATRTLSVGRSKVTSTMAAEPARDHADKVVGEPLGGIAVTDPTLVMIDRDGPLTTIRIAAHTNALSTRRERHHLFLIHELLGADGDSSLQKEVRQQRGLSYDVRTELRVHGEDSALTIRMNCTQENIDQALKTLHGLLQDLEMNGPTGNQLSMAKLRAASKLNVRSYDPARAIQDIADGFGGSPAVVRDVLAASTSDLKHDLRILFPRGWSDVVIIWDRETAKAYEPMMRQMAAYSSLNEIGDVK